MIDSTWSTAIIILLDLTSAQYIVYTTHNKNGKFSIGDIVADVAGIILAYVIFVGV